MSNQERIDMINLWISELKRIKDESLESGEISSINSLKLKRISKEIREELGEELLIS